MSNQRVIGTIKKLFPGGLLVLLCLPVSAQLIRVESILSRDSIMIGEQIEYTLRIDADSELEFAYPNIVDTLSKTLEVISHLPADTTASDGRIVVQLHYRITGFDAGAQIVPSQEVLYFRGELQDTVKSMPVLLHIYDPPVDTTEQIKPIKPPINTPLTLKEVFPWAAAGLGSLLLLGAVIWLLVRYLKRDKDTEEFEQKILEPAHVIAFRELDKLKEEKIWTKGQVKEYYTQLTEITRHYIERQYGIPAMESTTDDILEAFRKANPEDMLLDDILKELLELADLVKFAREDPLPVDNQTNLNNAYIFVQKTYPQFYHPEEKERLADE